MSPNVGNFVQDLVHMAQATERLPQVEAELDKANTTIETYAKQVQDREISILSLKSEIEALNSRIQAAEVARDDAEMRFLELDEKADKVADMLRTVIALGHEAHDALVPPKPGPLPEPEPVKEPEAQNFTGFQPTVSEAVTTQGQSESNPTASTQGNTASSETLAGSSQTAELVTAQEQVSVSTDKPYLGKFYYDHPTYVSYHDWIEGGGSEENYYRSRPRDFGVV